MSRSKPEGNSPGGCARAESAAAYVQDELGAAECAEFERHLASCAGCRDEVAAARGVLGRLRAVPDEPGADLVDRVLAALPADAWDPAARAGDGPVFRWASRALQAAAAIVAAATLGFVAIRGPTPDAGAPVRALEAGPVSRALAWLASAQEPDGSWDAEKWGGQESYTPALTGLAVLALLADDCDAGGARAGAARRAAAYLAGSQARSGRFGPPVDSALYNHGIATVALLEAYSVTRAASLREPISRALAYIRSEQAPSGGWGYAGGRQVNTAITVWQVNALLLAGSLGWPEARGPAAKGLAWLGGVIDAEGRAGYDARGRFPNGPEGLTAMAALSLVAGGGASPRSGERAARAARLLAGASPRGRRELDYYRSFFLAYALRAVEDASSGTDARSREMLVGSQVTEGPNTGSFEPRDRWSATGGRVYSTAMAALSLQADENAPRLVAMMRGGD